MFPINRLEIYGIGALILVLAFGGAYVKGRHDGKEVVQEQFDLYRAQVAAEAKAAAADAKQKEFQSKVETQNVQVRLDTALADNRKLLVDAAKNRAGSGYLPSIPAGTPASVAATTCFDRPKLDAALSAFGTAVAGVVGEGAVAVIQRDGWHRWYDAQVKTFDPTPIKK